MNTSTTIRQKDAYYDINAWNKALTHLDYFRILLTEYHRKKPGKVKRMAGTVIFRFRQPVAGEILEQATLIDVTWKHTGLCYENGTRKPEYDLDKYLQKYGMENS